MEICDDKTEEQIASDKKCSEAGDGDANDDDSNNNNEADDDEQDEEDENKDPSSSKNLKRSSSSQVRESHDEAFWYNLCERYKKYQQENPGKKLSQRAFLKSREALEVTGAPRECRSFSRYLRRYEQGELNPTSSRRRRRSVGYVEIEERLSTYLQLRSMIFIRGDSHGATWAKLKQKCVKWGARELKELQSREPTKQGGSTEKETEHAQGGDGGEIDSSSNKSNNEEKAENKYSDFRASPGWLHKVLKRNNIESKYLQSEMDTKEEHTAMEEFIPAFHQTLVDLNISGSCLYNAAQTFLFYRQLPSTKQQRKNTKKHVPTSDRLALMVCTAADGTKVPLAAVSQAKSPFASSTPGEDDSECEDQKNQSTRSSGKNSGNSLDAKDDDAKQSPRPPVSYASHPNAWFDQENTLWWIHNVFWPFHIKQHGDVQCVLLLDHCPAHVGLEEIEYEIPLPQNLKILYFPVNMSRKRHPAEEGIIGNLKLGYKLKMVSSVLALFDLLGGFQGAQDRYYRDEDKIPGTGGLACGDPATLLESLYILKQVWSSPTKFVTTSLVLQGWTKSNLLPTWWEEEIDTWIRNGPTPRAKRKEGWIDYDCVQLCNVLKSLAVKTEESGLEKHHLESSALKNSFLLLLKTPGDSFRADKEEEVWAMASVWIEIEDDPIVRDHMLEYECDQILSQRKRARDLEKILKQDEEEKTEDQIYTRYDRVQQGLEEARDYGKYLGMEEKFVHLIDRFENKLSQMFQKIQNVKLTDGRRKRVKLNAEDSDTK